MSNRGKNALKSSNNVEWGTPVEIVSSVVRRYLGTPFLDPFSSELANAMIMAKWFFTEEDDGFWQDWCQPDGAPANVWINHPFGINTNRRFVDKLEHEVHIGNVNLFAGICYDSWGTEWFSKLAGMVKFMWHPGPGSPGCTKYGRVAYVNLMTRQVETSPQKSSVVYFGWNGDHWGNNIEIHLQDLLYDMGGFLTRSVS